MYLHNTTFVCVVAQGYGGQYSSKDTALMEFLKEGVWFIGVFNDGDSPQTISYVLNDHGECTYIPHSHTASAPIRTYVLQTLTKVEVSESQSG